MSAPEDNRVVGGAQSEKNKQTNICEMTFGGGFLQMLSASNRGPTLVRYT